MSDDLVKRLRDWEHVWPEDYNKPAGSLYISAADRIEELEERLKAATDDAKEAEAYAGEMEAVLERIKAKLAMAEDFCLRLERFADQSGDNFLLEKAREALAELKGACG